MQRGVSHSLSFIVATNNQETEKKREKKRVKKWTGVTMIERVIFLSPHYWVNTQLSRQCLYNVE